MTDCKEWGLRFVILSIVLTAVSPVRAETDLLATFDRSLKSTKDVTARFTQTRHSPLLEDPIVAHGTVWIRYPGDVRFEYEEPDPMTLLKHADTTWLYVPELEQVQKSRASAAGVPMGWVLGSSIDQLREEATVEVGDGHIVVRPLPELRSPWQRIEIRYEEGTEFPSRYAIYEESGEVVEIRLRRIERNAGVDPERFEAEWPAGIDVITLGE